MVCYRNGNAIREIEMEDRMVSKDPGCCLTYVDYGFSNSVCRYSELTQREGNLLERTGSMLGRSTGRRKPGFVVRFCTFSVELTLLFYQ